MTIVKVQLPLMSTRPDAAIIGLVYAKGKRHLVEQPIDGMTRKLLGGDAKGFFEAEYLASKGIWSIGKRVEDREW